jgi:hypothetical protein
VAAPSIRFRVTDGVRGKLERKHRVLLDEVHEALDDPKRVVRRVSGTRRSREATYLFLGRTLTGRLLRVVIIAKPEPDGAWLKTALDAYEEDWTAYDRRR